MRCFNHPNEEAVGSFKHCHKGLCKGCAVDLGYALACDEHKRRVELENMVLGKNIKAYSAAPRNMWIMPIFLIFAGLVLTISEYRAVGTWADFGVWLGVGFIVVGVVQALVSRKIFAER